MALFEAGEARKVIMQREQKLREGPPSPQPSPPGEGAATPIENITKLIAKRGIQFFLAVAGMIFLQGGCAVGPDYKRPPVASPGTFRGESQASTNSLGDLPWWEVFHDENLKKLVRTAITNNYNVRIAAARVEQTRAMVTEARSQLFPQLNYSGAVARGNNVGLANTPAPGTGEGSVIAAYGTASWEIDLWGKVRRMTEAAKAQFFASQEAQRDVRISLIAQVAQDYFQLLALDRELAIAREATNSYGQSLKIFEQRLRGGVASKLETSAAEALLDSSAAMIPDLERQIVQTEDALSVLLGTNAEAIMRENSVFEKQLAPEVPAGLPSALLERRPDVREAEQFLRSANAQVGVAKANFFPELSLTALLGKASPELSALTSGSSTAWSLAAGLTGPIFQGGQLRAQYREAKAVREQYVLQYQQTALTAFQEVADALVAREKLASVRTEQERAVAAYHEAFRIATERYQQGQSSYYEVLQEQQLLFPAENTLAQTQFNQLSAIVQLYRSLGGGWEDTQRKEK
jgi:outer membrane protein, multidrug efflux system